MTNPVWIARVRRLHSTYAISGFSGVLQLILRRIVSQKTHKADAETVEVPTTRAEKALYALDTTGLGLEIGPSYNPIAPKAAGYRIHTLDHATQIELQEKYRNQGVDIRKIEPVDFVWRGQPLDVLTGGQEAYSYIIAAHVIEHVPDLIGFLQQCTRLLRPEGRLSLIVPDMRYCFDALRWPTTTGELLDAHGASLTRHSPGAVFDHHALAARLDQRIAWRAGEGGKLHFVHDLPVAHQLWQRASTCDDYIDIHRWRYTPASFRLILADLHEIGLIELVECSGFGTTDCEFFVTLVRGKNIAVDRLELAIEAHREVALAWAATAGQKSVQ